MRPGGVVVLPPLLDDLSGLIQGGEHLGVQALLAAAAVEALDVAVVRRLAGPDELQLHARGLGPAVQGLAGELRAVVRADDSRAFALGSQPLQHPGHALAGQRVVRFQAGTAAVPQVHDRQHPEPPAILQAVAHEVHGPLLVRPGRPGRYHAQVAHALAPALEPQ